MSIPADMTPNPEMHGEDMSDINLDDVNATLAAITHLLLAGDLELPDSPEASVIFNHLEVSEKAKAIAKRVESRLLQDLGLATLGGYLTQMRTKQGLQPIDIARKLNIARDVIVELETDRLPFYQLPPAKAVDLVEVLRLDGHLVIDYLRNPTLAGPPTQTTTSLFRINQTVSKQERRKSQVQSHTNLSSTSREDQAATFLNVFERELTRRGLT